MAADAEHALGGDGKPRHSPYDVGQGRERATPAVDAVDIAEDTRPQRYAMLGVILREPFGFDARHVHPRWTLGGATFAFDAQVHGLVHTLAGERSGVERP